MSAHPQFARVLQCGSMSHWTKRRSDPGERAKCSKPSVSYFVSPYGNIFAKRRKKIVVFCKRLATIQAFRDELRLERKRWDRVRGRMNGKDLSLLRLAVHCLDRVPPGKERMAISRLRRVLVASGLPGEEGTREGLWQGSWGPRRHVDWGAVVAGAGDHHESGRSPQVAQFAFNLPGPPAKGSTSTFGAGERSRMTLTGIQPL